MAETLSTYLLTRLSDLGVEYVYGVPGDYNLALLDAFESVQALKFIGTCNELNAVYAADGHARMSHRIGALIATYGVGDLGMLSGVAGAFAERVPLLVISGTPPLHAQQAKRPMHHTLGDGAYGDVLEAFKPFTVAQAVLTPDNAREEIERVLAACLEHRRPVYLQLPSDLAEHPVPEAVVAQPAPASAVRAAETVALIVARLRKARMPAFLLDADLDRFQLTGAMRQVVDKLQVPFAAMVPAKGLLDESHPGYTGIYNGSWSAEPARLAIEGADCLVAFGARFTDTCSGLFTHSIDQETLIDVQADHVCMGGHRYPGVGLVEIVNGLAVLQTGALGHFRPSAGFPPLPPPVAVPIDAALNHQHLWADIQAFLQPNDLILAENGSAMSAALGLRLPPGATLITQPNWGAIGYTLPATLGAMLAAPQRRTLLFIGDGALQMTAQELSTLLRHGLKPIVFVINNHGYTIERLMRGAQADYNDVATWRYQRLLGAFGGSPQQSLQVATVAVLRQALGKLTEMTRDGMVLVELLLPRMDAPARLFHLAKCFAEYDDGPGQGVMLDQTAQQPSSKEAWPERQLTHAS